MGLRIIIAARRPVVVLQRYNYVACVTRIICARITDDAHSLSRMSRTWCAAAIGPCMNTCWLKCCTFYSYPQCVNETPNSFNGPLAACIQNDINLGVRNCAVCQASSTLVCMKLSVYGRSSSMAVMECTCRCVLQVRATLVCLLLWRRWTLPGCSSRACCVIS